MFIKAKEFKVVEIHNGWTATIYYKGKKGKKEAIDKYMKTATKRIRLFPNGKGMTVLI